jgi:hypothetical protein
MSVLQFVANPQQVYLHGRPLAHICENPPHALLTKSFGNKKTNQRLTHTTNVSKPMVYGVMMHVTNCGMSWVSQIDESILRLR